MRFILLLLLLTACRSEAGIAIASPDPVAPERSSPTTMPEELPWGCGAYEPPTEAQWREISERRAGKAAPHGPGAVETGGLPGNRGWVSDLADLLTAAEEGSLAKTLASFEARTGSEFAVLTVASTEAETIEAFSLRVARDWGVGKAGSDNGLLIVVAREDREVRIEVGRGLEDRIPDALAKEIMTRDVVPAFAGGRWADGLQAGVQSLMLAAEQR